MNKTDQAPDTKTLCCEAGHPGLIHLHCWAKSSGQIPERIVVRRDLNPLLVNQQTYSDAISAPLRRDSPCIYERSLFNAYFEFRTQADFSVFVEPPPATDDMVSSLRFWAGNYTAISNLLVDAADRITELSSRVQSLEASPI